MVKRLLPLLFVAACGRDVTAPADAPPADATRFTPAGFEAQALDSVRSCISRNGSQPNASLTVEQVAWYTVPGPSFTMPSGAVYEGFAGHGWIVMASEAPNRQQLTEHELAHELVAEAIPHSSAFWTRCNLMVGYGTSFVIPTP